MVAVELQAHFHSAGAEVDPVGVGGPRRSGLSAEAPWVGEGVERGAAAQAQLYPGWVAVAAGPAHGCRPAGGGGPARETWMIRDTAHWPHPVCLRVVVVEAEVTRDHGLVHVCGLVCLNVSHQVE